MAKRTLEEIIASDPAMQALRSEQEAAKALPMPTSVKPCPFCGDTPDMTDPDFVYPVTHERTVWGAHCTSFGVGCGASMLGWSAAEAVSKWNERTC